MKVSEPFKLFVPISIKNCLTEYLKANPPGFRYDVFELYFIINYLVYKQVNIKAGVEYFKINKSHFHSITNSKTDKYLKYLLKGEFIFRDNYVNGIKSYHYKLNPKFDLDLNTESIEPGSKLFDKIQKKHRSKRAHFNRLEPHLKEMKNKLMDMEYNADVAKKYIYRNPDIKKRIAYFNQIESLADKRLRYFKRSKTNNRLYTPVTNLKRELRPFIVSDVISIDLKNSQPFFLGQLLIYLFDLAVKLNNKDYSEINNNTILCYSFLKFNVVKTFGVKAIKSISKIHQKQNKSNLVNLKEFTNCVNDGNLYEFVGNYFEGKYSRIEIKDMLFKVLFSRNVDYVEFRKVIPYEHEKKIFANVFPFVAESVFNLKHIDFKRLPILLQKIESFIFIDCISKELVNAGIVPITIHDSVIIDKEHHYKAMEIIKEVFVQNFNVVPTFHIK